MGRRKCQIESHIREYRRARTDPRSLSPLADESRMQPYPARQGDGFCRVRATGRDRRTPEARHRPGCCAARVTTGDGRCHDDDARRRPGWRRCGCCSRSHSRGGARRQGRGRLWLSSKWTALPWNSLRMGSKPTSSGPDRARGGSPDGPKSSCGRPHVGLVECLPGGRKGGGP